MKCIFDLVLAVQQGGLVQNACCVEVTRAHSKEGHAVHVTPARIERTVISHVEFLELLDRSAESARVHQLLSARDPVRSAWRRALLQFASSALLPGLNGRLPRLQCGVSGVIRTPELGIDIRQDREQRDTIADTVFSAREPCELLGGDLQLAELNRAIRSDRAVAASHRNVTRRGVQQYRSRVCAVPALRCSACPSAHRVMAHRLGERRRSSRELVHRIARPANV